MVMHNDERDRKRIGDEQAPLAVENADMSQSREELSDVGEMEAKRLAVAIEGEEDPESGGVAEQRAYLRWEARVDDEEREERGKRADIHNTPHDQHKD